MRVRLITLALLVVACGGGSGGSDYGGGGDKPPAPVEPAPGTAPAGSASFASVKPTIDKECGRCHNGRIQPVKFDSEAKFKTADVKRRIESGAMPPDRPLSSDAKAQLLAVFR